MKTNINYSKLCFLERAPEIWSCQLEQFKNKHIQYLEVGVFEGQSLFWMLENFLTTKDSRATAVDIFSADSECIFLENLSKHLQKNQVNIKKGFSGQILRNLPLNSFDIIYIDASHMASNVFIDSAFSWGLLKVGGVLIFDDFLWKKNVYPIDLRPELPIETFITSFSNNIDVFHKEDYVFIKKVDNNIFNDISRIGKVEFNWKTDTLIDNSISKKIILNESELIILKQYLKTKKIGQVKPDITTEFLKNSDFVSLSKKMSLN